MSHSPLVLAAGVILALSLPAHAEAARDGSSADARIKAQLSALEYDYEVDEDNDFKLVFAVDETDRSQIVYVRSPVETYGSHAVREIWSPGYASPDGDFPARIANRLLEASGDAKLGGWVKQGRNAVFVVKIAADAGKEELDDAIDSAVTLADQMEAELTPGKDDL
ncbi:hypothetical protein [Pseudoxanthomonas gei]|uniref:hypothetical protein n=1 Tax=Pseudoxanthomonas gei TaxID=1383030 RepID=UPI001B8643E4|nr:hypothetical protein [Pseudoxanthomonas gei]